MQCAREMSREAAVEIGERRQANILVLRPVGRIDDLTSSEFQSRLLAAVTSTGDELVVDFSIFPRLNTFRAPVCGR